MAPSSHAALVGLALLALVERGQRLADGGAPDAAYREASLAVKVGETASEDVGYARGLVCDDLSIISARLEAVSPSANRLYVTGVKPGSTACRVGTSGLSPVVLVHVVVTR